MVGWGAVANHSNAETGVAMASKVTISSGRCNRIENPMILILGSLVLAQAARPRPTAFHYQERGLCGVKYRVFMTAACASVHSSSPESVKQNARHFRWQAGRRDFLPRPIRS